MYNRSPLKIAVASGKGGTGKTLLSTNLAVYLSQVQPTLLVDLDVEEPNDFIFIDGITESVDVFSRMLPEWRADPCTLCGICSDTCKFHAVVRLGTCIAVFGELCHSCYACSELCPVGALPMRPHQAGEVKTVSSGNLRFLESRLTVGEEQAVPLIHYTHDLVETYYKDWPVQIFDCPPGTSCPVVASVRKAGFVILVTEPTPFGLNDLKLAVETMRKLAKPMGVVINRYGIGNRDVERYCEQEQIAVLARISFSREIAGLYARGKLVYEQVPEVKVSLQQIMEHILKITQTDGD